jgi:glutamate-ammonia-ligase adenylyltransferase
VGDLAGAFDLTRVTGELSDLADRAVDAAIAHGIRSRAPDAEPAGLSRWPLANMGRGS